ISVGGVVVAGAGSLLDPEQYRQKDPPIVPVNPNALSKQQKASIQQGLPSTLPKLDLPPTETAIHVTADGVWANGQFFSTESLRANSSLASAVPNNPVSATVTPYSNTNWK